MFSSLTAAVIAGLAVGIGLFIVFGVISSSSNGGLPPSALSSSYNENQKIAIRIAISNETVQQLFNGKEMETGVVRQTDQWGIASQSDPNSTTADQYKFSFDIEIGP